MFDHVFMKILQNLKKKCKLPFISAGNWVVRQPRIIDSADKLHNGHKLTN